MQAITLRILSSLMLFFCLTIHTVRAISCDTGEVGVVILIDPDDWPDETSWAITDADGGVVAEGEYGSDSLCLDEGMCYTFHLYDSYGDGIYAPHGVELYFDGELLATFSGDFGYSSSIDMGCPPGTSCGSAIDVTTGSYTAPAPNTWYKFNPEEFGTYQITTCDLENYCNTQIWVYEYCAGLIPSEFAEGTTYYNDDWCGEQSFISGIFLTDKEYYIRIGDLDTSCEGSAIHWQISYVGPPSGCTDPYACNYAPLAVVDDGSCLYPGDPACPLGPDLVLDSTYFDGLPNFSSDFSVELYDADWDDCAFEEACVTGVGNRYVMKFGVKINNIGDLDYHLGSPDDGAPGFVYSPCHGHWHYADYGEYILYDAFGNEIPAGHKNGYAVMDIGCFDGTPQYGGDEMGISAGCYDIYGRGTSCQWVDLTDIPDGNYTLVARVNWENHPDADGNTETDISNNWISICINVERDAPGDMPTVTKVEDCAPYYDCYGEIFGSAQLDCNGVCNGPGRIGDLNLDTARTAVDVDEYLDRILSNTIIAASCNDANADGDIDLYDAALVNGCAWQEAGITHIVNLCNMPYGFLNTSDTVTFSIGEINPEEEYVDIYAKNISADILGFQLTMDGLTIDSIVKLASSIEADDFHMVHSDREIIGLGYNEQGFIKNFTPLPLFRVYFSAVYPTTICIDYVTTAVNEDYHEVVALKDDACYTLTGVNDIVVSPDLLNIHIYPHPVTGQSVFSFNNYLHDTFELELYDITGQLLRTYPATTGECFYIDKSELPAGMYIYKLKGSKISNLGKLIVQ